MHNTEKDLRLIRIFLEFYFPFLFFGFLKKLLPPLLLKNYVTEKKWIFKRKVFVYAIFILKNDEIVLPSVNRFFFVERNDFIFFD